MNEPSILARPDNMSQALPLPPGDFGLPVIGKTLNFFTDPDFARKQHEKYGPLFKTRLLGQPTIFLQGPDANRFLFSQESDRFAVTWPSSVRTLLGPLSLALQTGGVHAQRRRLMAQAFQPRALAGYVDTMEAISDAISSNVSSTAITVRRELVVGL